MAKIKSYTDIEQSKKLAEILPLESSDMCWTNHYYGSLRSSITISVKSIDEYKNLLKNFSDLTEIDVFYPAWSLSALLDALPNCTDIVKEEADTENEKYMCTVGVKDDIICTFGNNPVDACVTMIEKLNEQKML